MTFYRKYRSLSFNELLGQDSAVATLQGALAQDRIGHAYLFSGPRGTGKTSTARIFSRAICCTNLQKKGSRDIEPCGVCPSCLSILNNEATDVSEIDAASNRGVEDIRELREQVQYPPISLSHRIYIIDEVHMLTTEAFNALLKTLEEPPSFTIFILATTELHKVPLTIRSRCQLIRFEKASESSLESKIKKIISEEKLEADEGAISLIAEHAQGGFRDAETLLERLANQLDTLTVDNVSSILGIFPKAAVQKILDLVLDGDSGQALKHLRQYSNVNTSLEGATAQLIEEVRSRLYSEDDSRHIDQLSDALEQLLEAYILQRSAPTPLVPIEIALLSIASHTRTTTRTTSPLPQSPPPVVAEPPKAPARPLPSATPSKTLATPTVAPASATPSVPVIEIRSEPIGDIRKAWKEMADIVCRDNLVLGQTIKQAVFHGAEAGIITIFVHYKFHADKMNEKKNRTLIQELLHSISGSDWEVEYIVNPNVPRQKSNKQIGPGLEDAAAVFGSPPPGE